MKYKTWLRKWLILYVQPTVKEKSYVKYHQIVNTHLIPHLGEYELDDLSAMVLQEFIVALSNYLAPNTINGIISVIKNSLKRAVTLEICSKEYTTCICRPKMHEKTIECFTKDEQRQIEKYILEKNKPKLFGIIICLYTGLRIGELLSLKWDDLDLKKGLLFVSKTCSDYWEQGHYRKILDEPKTICSNRIIPIPKQLLPFLRNLKKQTTCEFVVCGGLEGAQVRSYQKTFERILFKLSIPHKGFHALRHTFATRALECGMDIRTLSEILGHKNPTITLKRYSHSLLDHKTDMMNAIGKLFRKQQTDI